MGRALQKGVLPFLLLSVPPCEPQQTSVPRGPASGPAVASRGTGVKRGKGSERERAAVQRAGEKLRDLFPPTKCCQHPAVTGLNFPASLLGRRCLQFCPFLKSKLAGKSCRSSIAFMHVSLKCSLAKGSYMSVAFWSLNVSISSSLSFT